jgi:hypothetical protein
MNSRWVGTAPHMKDIRSVAPIGRAVGAATVLSEHATGGPGKAPESITLGTKPLCGAYEMGAQSVSIPYVILPIF